MSAEGIRSIYEELKRRRVIRVATFYIIAFWPIIQVVDILSPALGLPDSLMRNLVFAFFGGFPVVLILAWVFDINRDGISFDDGKEHETLLSRKTEFGMIGILGVLVIGLFFVQMEIEEEPQPESTKVSYDSIAVLPFVIFSNESRDQFFADGLTEELLNVLSRMTELRVAARTSSFAYKGVNKNVQDIGTELGVATILEGSVRRNDVDDTIRVTAQLIDVSTGAHLWSETYERQFTDIFKIQDEISHAVSNQLQLTLFSDSVPVNRQKSANPEALIAYSMGQSEMAKRTEQGLKDAARFFQRAIDTDPSYALAYAGKADAHTLLVNYEFMDRTEGITKARESVDQALSLDPDLGIAWASKGLILSHEKGNEEQARAAFQKAIALNPSYAMAFMWYAGLLDDKAEQLEFYQKAYSLDPKSAVAGYNVATMLIGQGRDAEAMQIFSQIVEADPFYSKAYTLVGGINDRRGRIAEAISQYERSYDLDNDPSVAFEIAKLYAAVSDFDSSDAWYTQATENGIPEMYRSKAHWFRVQRFAADGDADSAMIVLKQLQSLKNGAQEGYNDQIWASYFLGEFKEATRLYEKSLSEPTGMVHQDEYTLKLATDAKIAAAFSYKQLGKTRLASQVTTNTIEYLDEQLKQLGHADPTDWYRKALLAVIEGKEQVALIYMQRAVDEGWREYWRPAFEPALEDFMSQKPFQAMMAGLETRLDIIREQFKMEEQFAAGWSN